MKKFLRFLYIPGLLILTAIILVACSKDKPRIEACNTDYETALTQGTCIMQIALEKESEKAALKVCDKINNGVKDTCIRNIAVKFDDKPLCFLNENEIETYICLSNLAEKNQDVSICKEIGRKKDEDFCYRKVAVAKRDESLCENITGNDEFKQLCAESVDFAKQVIIEEDTGNLDESES